MKTHPEDSEKGFTGKMGDVVYYQRYGQTLLRKAPGSYNKIPTAKQAAARARFTEAQQFAKSIITNPVLKALYDKAAGNRCTAYSMAVSEYLLTKESGQWIL